MASGACCEGTLTPSGSCCTGTSAVIDATGKCCASGVLNACGNCDDGTDYVTDVIGQCCTDLDAAGYCCFGSVDVCGVCDGVGACTAKVDTTVGTPSYVVTSDLADPSSATRMQLDADLKTTISMALNRSEDTVTIDKVEVVSRRLSAFVRSLSASQLSVSFFLIAISTTEPNVLPPEQLSSLLTGSSGPVSFQGVQTAYPRGVCGNGVCEINERCDASDPSIPCCSQDCPVPIAACPLSAAGTVCDGRGICLTASTGVTSCRCFTEAGYLGSTCSECVDGWLSLNGQCQHVASAPAAVDNSLTGGDIAGIVIAVFVVCAAAVAAVWYLRIRPRLVGPEKYAAEAPDVENGQSGLELAPVSGAAAGAADTTAVKVDADHTETSAEASKTSAPRVKTQFHPERAADESAEQKPVEPDSVEIVEAADVEVKTEEVSLDKQEAADTAAVDTAAVDTADVSAEVATDAADAAAPVEAKTDDTGTAASADEAAVTQSSAEGDGIATGDQTAASAPVPEPGADAVQSE